MKEKCSKQKEQPRECLAFLRIIKEALGNRMKGRSRIVEVEVGEEKRQIMVGFSGGCYKDFGLYSE